MSVLARPQAGSRFAKALDGRHRATQNRGTPMRWRTLLVVALYLSVLGSRWAPVDAQRAGSFMGSSDDPAIKYSTASLNNAVVDLNKKLQDGTVQFAYDERSGFLKSALDALQIPVDSQLLVFSRASLQGRRIGEQNPRALFFNEATSSASRWAGCAVATCSRWPRPTRRPASSSTSSNRAPIRRPGRRSSSGRSNVSAAT
jgi:hypothetical protein